MTCPVCLNSGTVPHAFKVDPFTLSECRECNCLFIDPAPTQDELSRFYPEHYWWGESPYPAALSRTNRLGNAPPTEGERASASERRGSELTTLQSLEGLYRRLVLRDHLAFIKRSAAALPHPPRILDIGCGSATLLGLLKKKGFRVLGMDSSRQAATLAKAQSDVDVVVAPRLQDAGFADASFDILTLFHVIEHLPDPRSVLAEVRRILQPKGRAIIQVPNIESWQFKLCGSRWAGLDVPRHVVNHSCRSIQRLLAEGGFRICRVRHFNLRDNAPALASSLFFGLDPAHRRARSESASLAWIRHAAYLTAVAAVYPIAIAESLARRGGTIMLEAEKA